MSDVLVGHTGFVGSNLLQQRRYDHVCNSKTVDSFRGLAADRLVFCGAQAKKWWANANPEDDWNGIARALSVIETMRVKKAVLISTVDVLPNKPGLDESFEPQSSDHPYGNHRLQLENAFKRLFDQVLIVRLPALFGPGLKKNVIYDLIHDNQTELIQPNSAFQYYDLRRLSSDIEIAEAADLSLVHLFPEPLKTQDIIDSYFQNRTVGQPASNPVTYDFRTRHGDVFGSGGHYLYSAQESLDRLGEFLGKQRMTV